MSHFSHPAVILTCDFLEQLKLSYYEQMKLINWIRLEKHKLGQLDVMEITERILAKEWNASQYYFPTFQNDALLHFINLDDKMDDEGKKKILCD